MLSTTRTLPQVSKPGLTSQNFQVIPEDMHLPSTNWKLRLHIPSCGIPQELSLQLFHVHLSGSHGSLLSFSIAKSFDLVLLQRGSLLSEESAGKPCMLGSCLTVQSLTMITVLSVYRSESEGRQTRQIRWQESVIDNPTRTKRQMKS